MNKLEKQLLMSPYVKPYGRTYLNEEECLGLGFSFSGVQVTFKGTSLKGEFLSPYFDVDNDCPYIAVYVDKDYLSVDDLENTIMVKLVPGEMTLVRGLTDEVHTVMIRKLSEANGHKLFLKHLTTDGEFLINKETKIRRLFIEFYGDSLTAGLGELGSLKEPAFKTEHQNVAIGYAPLAAAELNADISIVALSGYPMAISPYVDNSKIKRVPEVFSCADMDGDHYLNELPQWNNDIQHPDLVVINLGANDRNFVRGVPDRKQEVFDQLPVRYNEFLDLLKKTYPNAKILMLTFGIYCREIMETINDIYESKKDPNIFRLDIDIDLKDEDYGTGWHPDRKTHKKYSEILSKFISEKIRWN